MRCKNIILVLLIALAVRAVYLLCFFEPAILETEDQSIYLALAASLAQNGWAAFSSERAPGYPIFLATVFSIFGKQYLPLVLVQALVDSVTCVVIGALAQRVIGRGFLLAGLLAAMNLNMVIVSAMALTDTLFLFFFSLSMLCGVMCISDKSPGYLLLAITLLAVATMVRSTSYYLIPVAIIALILLGIFRGTRTKAFVVSGVIGLIVAFVVLLPQYWQNWTKYGEFNFVSQGGVHLLGWVVPAVYQYSGGGSYEAGQSLAQRGLETSMAEDKIDGFSGNPFEESRYKTKVASDLLKGMGAFGMLKAWAVGSAINFVVPSAAFAPVVRSFEHPSFYATPGKGALEKIWNYVTNTSGVVYILILASGAVSSLIFFLLSLWGCYLALIDNDFEGKASVLFLLCVTLYILFITGPIIGSKYRLPIEPIMTVFVTVAILHISRKRGGGVTSI